MRVAFVFHNGRRIRSETKLGARTRTNDSVTFARSRMPHTRRTRGHAPRIIEMNFRPRLITTFNAHIVHREHLI